MTILETDGEKLLAALCSVLASIVREGDRIAVTVPCA